MKRFAFLALCAGCTTTDLSIELNKPSGVNLFASLASTTLTVTRDTQTVAVSGTTSATSSISLAGVSYGEDTIFDLEGFTSSGGLVAHGRTCPITFAKNTGKISMYFAPKNYVGSSANDPQVVRTYPAGGLLDDGTVMIAGGGTGTSIGTAYATTDVFTAGTNTFADGPVMTTPRFRPVGVSIPGVGFVATGGTDVNGKALDSSDVYVASLNEFVFVKAQDARVQQQAVVLSDGSVFITGGRTDLSDGTSALSTTEKLIVSADGTTQSTSNNGINLTTPRYGHSAVLIGQSYFAIGGYDAADNVLGSIELFDFGSGTKFQTTGTELTTPRALATASETSDGSILIVGGVDKSGAAISTAELYNRDTRAVTNVPMVAARWGHTATTLPDGSILIAGGFDAQNAPVKTLELYITGNSGFVSAPNDLSVERGGQVAVTNCDDSVLFVGAGLKADVFTPAAYSASE